MFKRLVLISHDSYERAITENYAIKMMVNYAEGREHDYEIGIEGPGINKWDDIVIAKANGNIEHIQIKHANAQCLGDAADKCERDNYTRQPRKNQPRELSEFDKTIEELMKWHRDKWTEDSKRRFKIILPGQSIEIKKELSVAVFKSFLVDQLHRDGCNADSLEIMRNQADGSQARNVYNWLTTWCGFQNWNGILSALKLLHIDEMTSITAVDDDSKRELLRIVIPDRIVEAEALIFRYLYNDLSYTSGVTPRRLLFQIRDMLRNDFLHWTQFEIDDLKCAVSGISDFNTSENIERPQFIIDTHWHKTKEGRLFINSSSHSDHCELSTSLARIALHKQSQTGAHCLKPDDIKRIISVKCGKTLGVSSDDLDGVRINPLEDIFKSNEQRSYATLDEMNALAKTLHLNMSLHVWSQIQANIKEKILGIPSREEDSLQSSVSTLWSSWKSEFEAALTPQSKANITRLHELLCRILKPEAERADVDAQVRVGLKTAIKLSYAIFMQLLVSACIPDKISSAPVNIINGGISTLGLAYWSGPSESLFEVQKIDDTADSIIGKNKSPILILSEVTLPETLLEHKSLASSTEGTNSLADGRKLKAVITNSKEFRILLSKGYLSDLRNHFLSILATSPVATQRIGV